jgi:DNA-binding SARP family transcriptional activator
MHNYSEEKKVAMASLEFEGYANIWWEQVTSGREENLREPIATWEEMKLEMHTRFVPDHYTRDLFNKLQKLIQGTKSVEEYFNEMELTMMRLKLEKKEEQTMARFFNGLKFHIKRIIEFLPSSTLWDLVHKATRAEHQLQEEAKHERTKGFFASRTPLASTPTTPKLIGQRCPIFR